MTVAPVFLLGESSVEVGAWDMDTQDRPAAQGTWQEPRPHACSQLSLHSSSRSGPPPIS